MPDAQAQAPPSSSSGALALPQWLEQAIDTGDALPVPVLAARIALSFVLGCAVAAVYLAAQRKTRAETGPFVTTLVLLCILIAMVTMVIGNSVARAFSLVGALAIVRFRTVVEDTRDTAFVIFAVVVGMAVGAGDLVVALVGMPIVAVAAVAVSRWSRAELRSTRDWSLAVRLGLGRDPQLVLQPLFEQHFATARLLGTATARQGAALELSYRVRLRRDDDATAVVQQLNALEGVQAVELRQVT